MSKVSIVIAAYNVEKYIEDTLNSMLRQTLKDIEIVVVDDCSTDGTSAIIDRMAKNDARIKIVRHSENKSALIARKTGFAHSTGEYIMFLDGDDMYAPDACKTAYIEAKKRKTDVLQYGFYLFDEDGFLNDDDPLVISLNEYMLCIKKRVVAVHPGELLSKEKKNGKFNFNMWSKIYRRDLMQRVFENIPDIHLNMAEDILIAYLAMFFATSYDYISDKLYFYRYGVGITGNHNVVSDAKLEALARSWYVYKYLAEWTEQQGRSRACKGALLRIKEQMLLNIADTLFTRASRRQYDLFLQYVSQHATEGEIVLAIAFCLYNVRHIKPDLAAHICARTEFFASCKQSAKTIGVFYYRMYNGGLENVLSLLTDLWVKTGHEVVLFTDCEPNIMDYEVNPAVKRVTLSPITEPTVGQLEKRIAVFRNAMLEHKVDIMVYNAWLSPYFVMDALTVRSCNAKLLVHTHGMFCCELLSPDFNAAYNNLTCAKLYELADMVVALTDVDLAWWQNYGLRAEKTVNPIKMTTDVVPAKLQGHNVVLSGRIDRNKQTLQAVQIIETVRKTVPDVTLTLIGGCDDPEYKEQIEKYIKEQKLEETVQMVGFTPNVLPYYQNASVMLSTSRFEGFSLSLTESKMCGLPLVCYYLPNWDLARAPKGMINIEQDDMAGAAAAITTLLQDEALRKKMGAEARQSAEELFSIDLGAHWEHIFARTLQDQTVVSGIEVKPPMGAAIQCLIDFTAEGLLKRGISAPASDNGAEWAHYAEQCRILTEKMQELAQSESYRIGLAVTAIPRKIRNFFKKKR